MLVGHPVYYFTHASIIKPSHFAYALSISWPIHSYYLDGGYKAKITAELTQLLNLVVSMGSSSRNEAKQKLSMSTSQSVSLQQYQIEQGPLGYS